MAKFSVTEFFKGINTRINKFRIGSSEAINSENVDLSTLELKPQKGLDTSDTSFNSVDYKFKTNDIDDTSAIKFTESGDVIIKSYEDADPKFDRIYYNSSGVAQGLVGEKDLGVPAKPPTPSSSVVTSGTVGGTAQAFSSITTSTYNSYGFTPTADNSDIKSLPTSGAVNHQTGRSFTLFKRYGNTLVMYDRLNSKLKRVDVTTGNTPSGVTQELTITHSAKYFFSGDYFVGLDANYDNVSVVDTAYGGNTENTYSTNSQPTYTSYNTTTRMPGIGSLSLLDKSVGVNDDYLFIAKNYRANRYSYKARETSWVNSTSSYYSPAYYPIKLDRPVFYLYSGWQTHPNSWDDIEASSVLGSSNSITTDGGYLQFMQKYDGISAGFGRWYTFNQYDSHKSQYLFLSINGVRYTARIIYELILWQNSGYYSDYASSISHSQTFREGSTNYADYWRKDKTHATWIQPFDQQGITNDLTFASDCEIYANAMTGVSGTFYDNGDHTNGEYTNVPLMEASGEYTATGDSTGYPRPTHYPISQNSWSESSVSLTNYQRGLGAKATVVISSGSVQSVTITDGGRGWQVGDVFEIPTSQGVPFYGSSSNSNPSIGGSAGVYGTVTAIDNSLTVKVGTATPFGLNLSSGQITHWDTDNWGVVTNNTAPLAVSMYQPSNKMSIGGVTRMALSGGATIFKNFSDNIDTIPTQYGDLGAQYDTGGMNDYKPKYPIDNRLNDADYSPLRDNFLLQEKNYTYLSKSSISYVSADGWTSVQGKTYLIADSSNNNFSDSTFAIPNNSPYYSVGSTDETPITSSGGGIASGWYTMEATGLSATNDGVFNNPFGQNTVVVHRNILASGSTQFGNVQATLTLPISGYDKVRQDGSNAVYINSAENYSDSVAVISLQNLTVVNGTTFYGYANGADDIYKEGNFVFVSRGTNQTFIVNSAGNNEIAPVSAGMEYIAKVDTSNRIVYGLECLLGSGAPQGRYVKSQYFFFPSEILALTTGGIWDNRENASYNENIGMVMRGYANNTANDNYTILFSHDGDASFETDNEAYYLNIGTNRNPKIIATPVTKGTFTVIPGSGNVAWNGSNTLSYVPNDAMHQCQVGDLIELAPASGNFNSAVTYKISAYASATSLTLTGPVTGNALTASASGANQLFNVKRYVSRNRYFAQTNTFSGLSIPSSLPTFVVNGGYSGIDEMISFDDLPSTTKFIPHAKSASDAFTSGGNTYYYADLDRNIIDGSGVDVGEDTFTYGGLDIYNSEGANIPFQYKVSYLRNVKHTSETEPVLIEGPTSDETGAITLSNVTQSISLGSIGGNELSAQGNEITKVRVYRVGGDYARYYWLTDLDVANGSVTDYSDISLAVGSTLISPNNATAPPVDKLTNIVNANGFFVGSVGSKIYVSEFGNPHSYPESGQYNIDGNINHIEEVEGEAVVFTDNMIYRVRGFNYDSMNVASIPQNQGVSSENKGSVVKYLGSVYFISNDGLCEYRSGSVRVLSHNKFESFPAITSPKSAFKDGVLYIFEGSTGSSNLGVKVDLRGSDSVFSRISQKASIRALYNKLNDTLYVKDSAGSGSYGSSGDDLSITHDSGIISFGDLYSTKAVFGITVKYKTSTNPSNSSGQIKLYDHADTNFFTGTIANSTDETCLYFPFSNYSLVKYLRYKVTGEVTIYEIVFEQEPVETFINKMRFNYTDVQYIGDDMKVDLYVDNAIQTSNPNYATAGSTSLPTSSGNVKTVRLHYPKDVVGYIPHIYYTGTGRVLSYKYGTEDI